MAVYLTTVCRCALVTFRGDSSYGKMVERASENGITAARIAVASAILAAVAILIILLDSKMSKK